MGLLLDKNNNILDHFRNSLIIGRFEVTSKQKRNDVLNVHNDLQDRCTN